MYQSQQKEKHGHNCLLMRYTPVFDAGDNMELPFMSMLFLAKNTFAAFFLFSIFFPVKLEIAFWANRGSTLSKLRYRLQGKCIVSFP